MNVKSLITVATAAALSFVPPIVSVEKTSQTLKEFAGALDEIVTKEPTQPVSPLSLKPHEVIKSLENIGAIISSTEEESLHGYQIQSADQGYNQCWLYAGRNYIFMALLFLAKNKEEIKALYKAMADQTYADKFAEGLVKKITDSSQEGLRGLSYTPSTGEGRGATIDNLLSHYKEAFDGKLLPEISNLPSKTGTTDLVLFGNLGFTSFSKLKDTNNIITGGAEALKTYINEIEKTNVLPKSHLVHDVLLMYSNRDLLNGFEKLRNDDAFTILSMYFSKERPHAHGLALVITKEKDSQNNNRYLYLFADSLGGSLPKKQIRRFNMLLTDPTYLQETKLRSIVFLKSDFRQAFDRFHELAELSKQINDKHPEILDTDSLSKSNNIITLLNQMCNLIAGNYVITGIVSAVQKYYQELTSTHKISQFNDLKLYKEKYKPYLIERFNTQKKLLLDILDTTFKDALDKIDLFIKNVQIKEFSKEEIDLEVKVLEEKRDKEINDLEKRKKNYQQELEKWESEDTGSTPNKNSERRAWISKKPTEPHTPPWIENQKQRIKRLKENPKEYYYQAKELDLLKEHVKSSKDLLQKTKTLVNTLPHIDTL